MKIFTLLIAFMAWFKCAISPPPSALEVYDRIMKLSITHRLFPFVPSRHDHPYFRVENGDKITIHKLINGHFAPLDIVSGILQLGSRGQANRPTIDGQHGEVEVTRGDLRIVYIAPLTRNHGYMEHVTESGPGKYLCTIERENQIFLAAILRTSEELFVHHTVPRVLFKNHNFHDYNDDAFVGELFVATPVRMETLFSEL